MGKKHQNDDAKLTVSSTMMRMMIDRIIDAIQGAPQCPEMKLTDALEELKGGGSFARIHELLNGNFTVSFGPIKSAFLIRSSNNGKNGTLQKADIAVVMPSRNFNEPQDFQDGRVYLGKRLYFMARLAVVLRKTLNMEISFAFTALEEPIILIKDADSGSVITIRPSLRSKVSSSQASDPAVTRDAHIAVSKRKWDQAVSLNPNIPGLMGILEMWTGRLGLATVGIDGLCDLISHLVLTEQLSSLMSEFQMLAAIFRFLSRSQVEDIVPAISLHFCRADVAVLIEAGGRIRRSFEACSDGALACLTESLPIQQQCDLVFRLQLDSSSSSSLSIEEIRIVLTRGLGNRIRHLLIWPGATKPWSITETPLRDFVVGLIIDAQQAFRLADFGPLREQTDECAEFRRFWGSKSELRRLADGRIHESVVWEEYSQRRRDICFAICQHLSGLHFGVGANIERLAGPHRIGTQLDIPPSIQLAEYGAAVSGFTKVLRGLRHLPLAISRCEVFGPSSSPHTEVPLNRDNTVDLLVGFESSSHWPVDVNAANMSRTAFAIHLSRVLAKQAAGTFRTTRVSRDGRLDVEYYGGLVEGKQRTTWWFQCHIFCESELKRPSPSPASKALLESEYARAIKNLAMAHPAYGPTCRLVKSWISAQMQSRYLEPVLIDLLVAQLFVGGSSASSGNLVPQSAWIGFLLFLHLLATHEWNRVPILLGLKATADEGLDDQQEHEQRMTSLMSKVTVTTISEGLSVCIFTPVEGFQVPSVHSLRHADKSAGSFNELCGQARAALHAINQTECPITVLFRRSERSFDAVFEIGRAAEQFIHGLSKDDSRIAGFDPVKSLLADLETRYGRHIAIYHDPLRKPYTIAIKQITGTTTSTTDQTTAIITEIRKLMAPLIIT